MYILRYLLITSFQRPHIIQLYKTSKMYETRKMPAKSYTDVFKTIFNLHDICDFTKLQKISRTPYMVWYFYFCQPLASILFTFKKMSTWLFWERRKKLLAFATGCKPEVKWLSSKEVRNERKNFLRRCRRFPPCQRKCLIPKKIKWLKLRTLKICRRCENPRWLINSKIR